MNDKVKSIEEKAKEKAEKEFPMPVVKDFMVNRNDIWNMRHAYETGYIAGATDAGTIKFDLLFNFCHWLGREGFKVNGYDDGQLTIIINRFLYESGEAERRFTLQEMIHSWEAGFNLGRNNRLNEYQDMKTFFLKRFGIDLTQKENKK